MLAPAATVAGPFLVIARVVDLMMSAFDVALLFALLGSAVAATLTVLLTCAAKTFDGT